MVFLLTICPDCLRTLKKGKFVWVRGSAFEFFHFLVEEAQLRQGLVKEINLKILLKRCPYCGKEVIN